jgi:hypothetical protein
MPHRSCACRLRGECVTATPTRFSRCSRPPSGRLSRDSVRLIAVAFLAAVSLLSVNLAIAETSIWGSLKSLFGTRSDATRSKYQIYDSRTVAYTHGSNYSQFHWIDNDEIVFVAMHIVPDTSHPNKEQVSYAIKRWNIQTGIVRLVRDFGRDRPRLCLSQGHVLISTRRQDDTFEVYHGLLGSEKADNPSRGYSYVFCRPVDQVPSLPAWTHEREIRWLERLGDGFVDFGDRRKVFEQTQLRLFRHGAKEHEGIGLPLYRRTVKPRFPHYAFQNAFFVESDWHVQPRPKDIPQPVYWLYADGRVEKIADVPWGPWRTASLAIAPTKVGLVMASSNFQSTTDLGNAGLYLLKDGKVERILNGWIEGLALAVSPDGCKAAFAFAPVVSMKQAILRVIDLCSEIRK